ncbi:glutamate-5-semialdehyde dehydrogenase [PVC group bacterium]|nr:glutamate-5-semialdehyde dehydrogenase [PVC group bacterium]
MNLKERMRDLCDRTKKASYSLASENTEIKNKILRTTADNILDQETRIREENKKDLDAGRKAGLSSALLDRLELTEKRIHAMAEGLRTIADLKDPVGEILHEQTRPNGLVIRKIRVPIGVICIIYESRPNVTADAAGLALKSGNAVILRGGKEAVHSNRVIAGIIRDSIQQCGSNPDLVGFVDTEDREAVKWLLQAEAFIDMVIPRGGEGLTRAVAELSRIPVLKHYNGICHVYVDRDADQNMASNIVMNAKTQRPGVCNAIETLLVDKAIAKTFLPDMIKQLEDKGVEIRGCPETKSLANHIKDATEKDWSTEYLDLILSVRVVENIEEAVKHINTFGSRHSDAIVTKNKNTADRFMKDVDSATVYVNASTRFTDGFEFGMGAEMGISTDKLHARGPVGLEELTTYKYCIVGHGQIRT